MEISASESEWAWMESMSVLAYIYQFFDLNPEKGLAYMNTLSNKYQITSSLISIIAQDYSNQENK